MMTGSDSVVAAQVKFLPKSNLDHGFYEVVFLSTGREVSR